ncbi:hypothetical protein OG21DRAFT_1234824 [Imleria badia]|nr:hypothetical protein OG21DRAFT_1234824 [Imleria badia]
MLPLYFTGHFLDHLVVNSVRGYLKPHQTSPKTCSFLTTAPCSPSWPGAMVKTCHNCRGYSYGYQEANLKRCAGCRKVFYCSTECQKADWVCHIFNCKPRRPINTADYLALAVHQNVFPEHPQTCEDYGFNRVFMATEEKANLLGLYIILKTPPKTIHNWRIRGVLVDEIKATFYKIPEHARGCCFLWFLQNEHIIALAGQPLPVEAVDDRADAMLVDAWKFTGGSERDSPEEIRATIAHKPDEEQDCHTLYALLLSNWRPSPDVNLWVDFEFASCTSQEEEVWLSTRYWRLITIWLQVDNNHLRDLLQGGATKSVWYLKQPIVQEESTKEESSMIPAVVVDYGFMNCRNDSERRQLKRVYKAFFDNHNGDPLALHEAAIKGDIHGYLSTVVQGLKDPKFRRLMKNPYPLPDL